MLLVAGCEVAHFDGVARAVAQLRHDDRGVAHIALLRFCEVLQLDRERSFLAVRVEQRTEDRVGVEARQAGPDEAPAAVEQAAPAAVAHEGEVESLAAIGLRHARFLSSSVSGGRWWAPPAPGPMPPARGLPPHRQKARLA